MNPVVSIVVVNYNSGHRLEECIRAVHDSSPSIPFEIIVVDNCSDDGSCELARGEIPTVRLIRNNFNTGYGYAANQGFKESTGDYVLFLNPDIKVTRGCIDHLVEHLRRDNDLGAVAAYYVRPDGTLDKYYNRFPTIAGFLLTLFAPRSIARRFRAYRDYHLLDVDFDRPVEVPQPSTSCFLVRKALFGDKCIDDTAYFLFFTDVDICRKIYRQGKRILVFPDCKAIHDHDPTARSGDAAYLYALELYLSCANYFRDYHGVLSFFIAKLLFGIILGIAWGSSVLNFLLGRGDRKRIQRRWVLLNCFLRNRNLLKESERRRPALSPDV
jgi:GT2 family glycosyltransferase